jgi:hypothetical protein
MKMEIAPALLISEIIISSVQPGQLESRNLHKWREDF